MFTDLPRSTPKPVWKFIYRQYRIARHEINKACIDSLVYGFAAFKTGPDGVEHVSAQDLMVD